MDKAIKEGESYGETKKQLTELFERKGWTGTRIDVDSKGNAKKVELGTPRRIRTIINSNINSAYAAGRYLEQMEETDFAPYWQYMAVNDESTRPEHKALHLKVYKSTDRFWENFYPPNGWNCRCYVRNLTKRQVERMGYTVENTDNHFVEVSKMVGGEEKKIPAYKFNDGGIERTLVPDAGWETNVGKSAWGIDVAAWNKVKNLDENIKLDFLSKMAQNPHREQAFKTFIENTVKNDLKPQNIQKTITWLRADVFKNLEKNKIVPQTPVIVFQDNRVGHIIGDRQKITKEQLINAYSVINQPDAIYLDFTQQNAEALVYVQNIPNSDECMKVCVKLCKIHKKTKEPVNFVSTVGIVKKSDLEDKKLYKKIE